MLDRIREEAQLLKRSITQPGPLHLLDGQLDNPLHDIRKMGRKRSNSLSSMLSARRRAGEILRRRRRGRPSLLSVHGLQLICVVACALSAVILGVFPSLFGFGVLEASLGEGVVGTTFAASARRLNAIQVRPDGEIPALEFLNAVDELQPAFKVMGLMFELATKEVSTNLRKLRRAYTEFVDAEYASSSSAVQSGVAGGSSSNSSPPNSPRGGGGGHLAVRTRGFVSLQDLVWGPAGRPAADLIEGAAAGGGFGWGAGDDEDGGAGGEFKASAGLPHEVDAAGRKWLPVPQPVVTYEALLWLGFGLHFMETLYGCIGDPLAGEQPALCAKVCLKSSRSGCCARMAAAAAGRRTTEHRGLPHTFS